MKRFYVTKYNLYNEKVLKPYRIFIMSDLHFSKNITNKKLMSIYEKCLKYNPNYIFIPGDIIDSLDNVIDNTEFDRLLYFIEKLGIIATTLLSLGSHDMQYFKCKNTNQSSVLNDLIRKLKSLNNVYVLDNTYYEDDNIFVVGYTQSLKYYGKRLNSRVFPRSLENKSIMIKELDKLNKEIRVPINKPNFIFQTIGQKPPSFRR